MQKNIKKREKASYYIQNLLAGLSIQQVEALKNVKESKAFDELLGVFQFLTDELMAEVYILDATDPNLGIRKTAITGRGDGIIIVKQLFQHAPAELNRRVNKET